MTTYNITTPGPGNFTCPTNVIEATIEVWGAGGGGGGSNNNSTQGGGGGAGGGAYARIFVTGLVPGNIYAYVVAAGGGGGTGNANGTAGGSTSVNNNSGGNTATIISANGGGFGIHGANSGNRAGLGGAANESGGGITSYKGGNGSNGSPSVNVGGGGGAGAGNSANGADTNTQAGGVGSGGGGNGGAGGGRNANGTNGGLPAGAGGGAGRSNGTPRVGGTGLGGKIILTYFLNISETVTLPRSHGISISESISAPPIEETVSLSKKIYLTLLDQVNEQDSVSLVKLYGISISESVTGAIEETVSLSKKIYLTSLDQVSNEDSVSLSKKIYLTSLDQVSNEDSVSLSKKIYLTSLDQIINEDSVSLSKKIYLTSLDQVINEDSVSLAKLYGISIDESIYIPSIEETVSLSKAIGLTGEGVPKILSTPSVLANISSSTSQTSLGSGNISPTANSLLIAIVSWISSGTGAEAPQCSDNSGDIGIWRLLKFQGEGGGTGWCGMAIFVAQCGPSPGTCAVTASWTNSLARNTLTIIEVTGYRTDYFTRTIAGNAGTSTTLTVTLPATPLINSLIIAAVCQYGTSDPGETPGAGFTQLIDYNSGGATSQNYMNIMYDSAGADASADWSSLSPTNNCAIAIEIQESVTFPSETESNIFTSGFESGFSGGKHVDWDDYHVDTYGELVDDANIYDTGSHAARATVTDTTAGAVAYEYKSITWPDENFVYYELRFRLGNSTNQAAILGACPYLIHAMYHDTADHLNACLEICDGSGSLLASGQTFSESIQQRIRLKFVGKDTQANRQPYDMQSVSRETWHTAKLLIDLSGTYPFYAWWLDDVLVYWAWDWTAGSYNTEPDRLAIGASWTDAGASNKAQIWIDNVVVYTEIEGLVEETVSLSKKIYLTSLDQVNIQDSVNLAKYVGITSEAIRPAIEESVSLERVNVIISISQIIENDIASLEYNIGLNVAEEVGGIEESIALDNYLGTLVSAQTSETDFINLERFNTIEEIDQTNESDLVGLGCINTVTPVSQTNENDAVVLAKFIDIAVLEETQGFANETVILARFATIEALEEGISHVSEEVNVSRLAGINEVIQCQVNDSTILNRLTGISGITQCLVNDYLSLTKIIRISVIDETIGQYAESIIFSRFVGLTAFEEGISHVSESLNIGRSNLINISEEIKLYNSLLFGRTNGISPSANCRFSKSLIFARSNGLNISTQIAINENITVSKFAMVNTSSQLILSELLTLSKLDNLAILDSRYLLENINLERTNDLILLHSPSIFEVIELGKINIFTIITMLYGFNSITFNQFKSIIAEPPSLYVYNDGNHSIGVLFRDKRFEVVFRDKRATTYWRDKR